MMRVCGQTLVLIDNDATVSEVNQKIVRATLKYLIYHNPGNRAFCINTYDHDIENPEEYTMDEGDLMYRLDGIEYGEKDSDLTDALSEVISRWKEADFACRDILVFTDGLEGVSINHEKEELYYLTKNSEYPVYIVMLDQENNSGAKKGLLATAVTSGGKLFNTEFEGSDAAVDTKLGEMINGAWSEYALVHWKKYEENDLPEEGTYSEEAGEDETKKTDDAADERPGENETAEAGNVENIGNEDGMEDIGKSLQEGVIYEYSRPDGFFDKKGALIVAAALVMAGILIAFCGGFAMMKKKRRDLGEISSKDEDDDEDYFEDYELEGEKTSLLSDTTGFGDESATRLLSGGRRLVTLTDTVDSSRSYRLCLCGLMSIGRGACDVTISGDDALSKRHCQMYENEGEVYVKDLSSSNGTKVNDVRITEERLSDGDRLTIGARTYIVNLA